MARLKLYRNISIIFIICAAAVLCAVFIFFYSQATIVITPDAQTVNLSFITEVNTSSTAGQASSSDSNLNGTNAITQVNVVGTYNASSTKASSGNIVGNVKIVNNNSKPQKLVKTTQLQAGNGVIVRTNDAVDIPAGGSVVVSVYPADPAAFSPIASGQLKIIKLWPQLQDKIYGEVIENLAQSSGSVNYVGAADLEAAKKDLVAKAVSQALAVASSSGASVKGELVSFETDRKLGDQAKTFTMNAKVKLRIISVDAGQLSDLIKRKAQKMDLNGLSADSIDMSKVQYTILDATNPESMVVKVNYQLKAYLTESSDILNKSNFTNKTADEVSAYAAGTGAIKKAQTEISPFWRDKTPSDAKRIKIIIE